MKTIAAMLTLGVACWAFGTQAQTFDTRLLSQYDASVLRELYPVCRHTTVSAEQQVRLAERIRQENRWRFSSVKSHPHKSAVPYSFR